MTQQFTEEWGEAHQAVILENLRVNKPEDSRVNDVIIHGDGFVVSFYPVDGKYWSIAFCEAMTIILGLKVNSEIDVTDEMRALTESCFRGVDCHFGFMTAMQVAKKIEIKF